MKPMELKNYNLTTKLIIPLLDDNIVLEDVSEESGFINAFTDDINKPFYDNHIFFIFSYKVLQFHLVHSTLGYVPIGLY